MELNTIAPEVKNKKNRYYSDSYRKQSGFYN